MHSFPYKDTTIHYQSLGDADAPVVIWGHGWGQSHQAFMALATSLPKLGRHILIDFPGFGDSPVPDSADWGSRDYAECIAAFIMAEFPNQRVIWIGHSFGCRVGVQLAAHHRDLIDRMISIAGAGLPRKRSIAFQARVNAFKFLKRMPFIDKDKLRQKFGSADYLSAGALHQTFINVIREDLSPEAKKIACPVLLIYGADDTETPPEIGRRYEALIKNASMIELEGQDHYTVLGSGRHQVAPLIKKFISEYAS